MQVRFLPLRVLMSLRKVVDMSAVLAQNPQLFISPESSSFGGGVRNIVDNRTYFFFYRGIFIISGRPCPRGFIYPPSTATFPLTRLKCFPKPSQSTAVRQKCHNIFSLRCRSGIKNMAKIINLDCMSTFTMPICLK